MFFAFIYRKSHGSVCRVPVIMTDRVDRSLTMRCLYTLTTCSCCIGSCTAVSESVSRRVCLCVSATLILNILETKYFRGSCTKGSLWKSTYGASTRDVMDDVTWLTSYSWRDNLQSRCIWKLGTGSAILVDPLSTHCRRKCVNDMSAFALQLPTSLRPKFGTFILKAFC